MCIYTARNLIRIKLTLRVISQIQNFAELSLKLHTLRLSPIEVGEAGAEVDLGLSQLHQIHSVASLFLSSLFSLLN